jgi:hypothetical protein
MNDIIAIAPSNVYDDTKMEYLLKSSDFMDVSVEIIGVGETWKGLSCMIDWIADYLNNYEDVDDKIIVCIDAYDAFYISKLSNMVSKFKKYEYTILFSAEKCYYAQPESDKSFYDSLSNEISTGYKYLNTGGVIGYGKDLKKFYNGVSDSMHNDEKFKRVVSDSWDEDNDQVVISHYVAENWHNYDIGIDYCCDFFYTAVQDWDNIDKYVEIRDNNFFVKETESYPCVIHVPWKDKYKYILDELFNMKYGNISG